MYRKRYTHPYNAYKYLIFHSAKYTKILFPFDFKYSNNKNSIPVTVTLSFLLNN